MRDLVIGDVHGCLEELDELLRVVEYTPSDRLVFAGDLVDRGPDSVGVVRRVRELGAACVMGNHDEWYGRFRRRVREWSRNGTPNNMKQVPAKVQLYGALSHADMNFLESLPLYHRIDERTVVVHAGLRAGVPIDAQNKDDCLRMRYVRRTTGERWNMSSEELLAPSVAAYWAELWTGPDDVIYGHHPSKTDTVLTENAGVRCWGIDTGCCFGNKLTAWVRTGERIELASVPARAQYANWHHSTSE